MADWGLLLFVLLIAGGYDKMMESIGADRTVLVICVGLVCFAAVSIANFITKRRCCGECCLCRNRQDSDDDDEDDGLGEELLMEK